MKNLYRRICSLLLVLVLLCTALPDFALPARAEGEPVYSGSCGAQGDNLSWRFDPDSATLTVSGSGDMADYNSDTPAPWDDSKRKIEHIVIEEGVTGVGSYAFYYAENAVSLELPDSLTRIGEWAFDYCMDLKSVVIPDGVTELPKRVFCNCFVLESVVLPDGLTEIGPYAFYGCFILHAVNWPSSLRSIGESAFIHADLEQVTLPEGLTSVGANAFEYNIKLRSITFPDSVESFGSGVLGGCEKLTEVRLPAGLTEIPSNCFNGCRTLTAVEIPAGVTEIKDFAFSDCDHLWRLDIPEGVERIGAYAFSGCDWLLGMTLPSSISYMDFDVYSECDLLTGVVVLSRSMGFQSFREDLIFNGPENTILYGYTGTSIHQYADKHGYPFVDWSTHTHSYHQTVLEPSCTDIGHDVMICDCGDIQSEETLKALGHTYRGGKCIRCGKEPEMSFTDVSEGAYYYDAVMWAVENGITTGTGDGNFSPKQTCTRAQVMTFIWHALGDPAPASTENPFTDVKPDKWYTNAVLWAYHNDPQITSGATEDSFGINGPCTRAQVVTFLWHAAGDPEPETAENPFTDVKPNKWYTKAILWAVENGITSGMGEGIFGTNETCTRAQIVTFLYKALEG